jgi:hypothetical protein
LLFSHDRYSLYSFLPIEELNDDSKLIRIPGHRLILAAASPALRALVTCSAVTRMSNGCYEYIMDRDALRARAMQTLIQYIYTGFIVAPPSMPSLITVALMDIPPLRAAAATYGLQTLTVIAILIINYLSIVDEPNFSSMLK